MKKWAPIVVLLLLFPALIIMPIDKVKAVASPQFDQFCVASAGSGNDHVGCAVVGTATNVLFVVMAVVGNGFAAGCNGAGGGVVTVSSVSGDSLSWSKRANIVLNSACLDIEEWTAYSTASQSGTVTVTAGSVLSGAGNFVSITAISYTGVYSSANPFDLTPVTSSGSTGTLCGTASAVTTTNTDDLLLSGCAQYGGTQTAQSGYTMKNVANSGTNGFSGEQYKPVTGIQNAVTVGSAIGGGNQNYVAIADALTADPPTSIVTTVIACTSFQLQCWWYPMLFLGIGLTPFMLIGGLGKVNTKGLMYLLLAGLTFTSMVEVLMGMINIMFPLIFTIITIVYAVRIK